MAIVRVHVAPVEVDDELVAEVTDVVVLSFIVEVLVLSTFNAFSARIFHFWAEIAFYGILNKYFF